MPLTTRVMGQSTRTPVSPKQQKTNKAKTPLLLKQKHQKNKLLKTQFSRRPSYRRKSLSHRSHRPPRPGWKRWLPSWWWQKSSRVAMTATCFDTGLMPVVTGVTPGERC